MNHDVYVLVPGITGSVLEKDGHDVFGLSAEAGLRALFSRGHDLQKLRLDNDPPDTDDLGDGVTASRLAADAHLIPGLLKIDGYGKVASWLKERLRLVDGESYFELPYDWRRDNRVAARKLKVSAERWLEERRRTYPDAKLVLVGHSMGGLVSRYYLEVLDGWRDTRFLITFGTPFRGSVKGLDFLANGARKLLGLVDLTDLMRSFTSVHQLLPIYPCVDRGSGGLERLTEVPGVLTAVGIDPEKVRAAREFHAEIEAAAARHARDEEYHDRGYRVHTVVGIEQPTSQSVTWSGGRLTALTSYDGEDLGGDGTVPRVSASPQEATDDSDAMFAAARHASLQNADAVLTQVRGWVTGVDLGRFRAIAPVTLTMDLEDVYASDEPVRATVSPSGPTGELTATLSWVAGPGQPAEPLAVALPPTDGPRAIEASPRRPGCYRLTVSGIGDVEAVSDLVVVAPP